MIVNFYRFISRVFPWLKVLIWKQWYQYMSKFYQRKDWTFMNYGYAQTSEQPEKIVLDKMDYANQFCIQLYHHVVSTVELKGKDVIEIGSGRGGGADYINRYFKPNKMLGVDFSANAVEFCNKNYSLNGLSFEIDNAEALSFPDNSFDAVVNVESSHCYNSIDAFLSEVKRVLRDGGYFLFTDLRSKGDMKLLRDSLDKSGLTLISEVDITANVVKALELDSDNKMVLINKTIHKLLLKPFLQFAGTKGSKIYNNFKNRDNLYQSFVFQKQVK